jgi:FixJ family two-component response regulator
MKTQPGLECALALKGKFEAATTHPPGRQSAADALTAREREIVPLIADGLSNRDIAAELVISPQRDVLVLAEVPRHLLRLTHADWSLGRGQRPGRSPVSRANVRSSLSPHAPEVRVARTMLSARGWSFCQSRREWQFRR